MRFSVVVGSGNESHGRRELRRVPGDLEACVFVETDGGPRHGKVWMMAMKRTVCLNTQVSGAVYSTKFRLQNIILMKI
jgi:hypothetical protein